MVRLSGLLRGDFLGIFFLCVLFFFSSSDVSATTRKGSYFRLRNLMMTPGTDVPVPSNLGAYAPLGRVDSDTFSDYAYSNYHEDDGVVRVYSGRDASQIHRFTGECETSDDHPYKNFFDLHSFYEFGQNIAPAGDLNEDGHNDLLIVAKSRENDLRYVLACSGKDREFLFFIQEDFSTIDGFGNFIFGQTDFGSEIELLYDRRKGAGSPPEYILVSATTSDHDDVQDALWGMVVIYRVHPPQNLGELPSVSYVKTLEGTAPRVGFGKQVEPLTNLSGGVDDFAVSATGDYLPLTGPVLPTLASISFFSGSSLMERRKINRLDVTEYDGFGETLANVGDVNEDGYDDLATGAPVSEGGCVGTVSECRSTGELMIFSGNPDDNTSGTQGAGTLIAHILPMGSDPNGTPPDYPGSFRRSRFGDSIMSVPMDPFDRERLSKKIDFDNDGILDELITLVGASFYEIENEKEGALFVLAKNAAHGVFISSMIHRGFEHVGLGGQEAEKEDFFGKNVHYLGRFEESSFAVLLGNPRDDHIEAPTSGDLMVLQFKPQLHVDLKTVSTFDLQQESRTVWFQLDMGPEFAGNLYQLVGSTLPSGVVFGDRGIFLGTAWLPLNDDSTTAFRYYPFTVNQFNSDVLRNSVGYLDSEGRAQVELALGPGVVSDWSRWVGQSLFHAFVVYSPDGTVEVSNPVEINIRNFKEISASGRGGN